MNRKIVWVPTVALLLFLGSTCFYTVDRTEFVYLTQFGRHIATFDGADDAEAGLHVKWFWPVQSVRRVDRRLQTIELPPADLVTTDPKGTIGERVGLDAYVVWQVADKAAVDRFIVSHGSLARAQDSLRDRLRGLLHGAVVRFRLEDLIGIRKDGEQLLVEKRRKDLRDAILRAYREQQSLPGGEGMRDGIEIVDIQIRRLSYPDKVRQAIFERIISERNIEVAEKLNRGRFEADEIRSQAEARVSRLLNERRSKNEVLRAQANAEAAEYLEEAVRKNPELYAELQRMALGKDLAGHARVYSSLLFRLAFPMPKSLKGLEENKEPSPQKE